MAEQSKKKVLLIGWDGADWEHITPLLEEGLLPTLDGLINRGVMGNLATLQPVLSPMLWNSVATCKYPQKHGVHGFIEPDPHHGGARPYSSYSRKTKAVWNIFSQNGIRSNVVNWWASHPAEKINGCVVSNAFAGVVFDPEKGWRISRGAIHPEEMEQPFAKFKVFENELTQEHLLPFIPNAARIDQREDPRLGLLAKVLAETATTHSIATAVMEAQPWDFTAVYYTGIDHFSHGFMPYHPPRMPNVSEEDFEMYKGVIKGAYRFHDMMLERLLQLAGEDTTVVLCSDHGFQSREARPGGMPREPAGPAVWHRQYGVLVMAGPGIKRDERVYGASLIDVGPTLLTLYGLPLGEDMDGRPLLEAFEHPPEVGTLPSWDEVDGPHGMHDSEEPTDPVQADELMKQFVALGYIDDPGANKEKQQRDATIEAKYNLARSLMWQNKPDDARPLLEEVLRLSPWENRFLVQLADCYLRCGYLKQAERLIVGSFDLETTPLVQVLILYAKILAGLGRHDEASVQLRKAIDRSPRRAEMYIQIGDHHLASRTWREAERAYQQALETHPDSALALQGLSTIYLRRGENQQAADASLAAVGLLHRLPVAHFNLGVALARSGDGERAAVAFQTALRFAPKMRNAHRWLARVYGSLIGDRDLELHHRRESAKLLEVIDPLSKKKSERTNRLFDLPEIEPEADRLARLLKERPGPGDPVEKSGKTFVLVSGLPRSGTSLMMQMLCCGGMEAVSDQVRAPDDDNPLGYYEWEDVKQIQQRPELLEDESLDGKAIKMISMLLDKAPRTHDYKVIFMLRPIEEVAASQKRMIERLGTEGGDLDEIDLRRGLESHRQRTLDWLEKADHMEAIGVSYPDLVKRPESVIPQIVEFLGGDRLPRASEMAKAVDASLHRQRSS